MSHEISSNFRFWWMSESYLKDISVSLQACVCLLWAHKHHETTHRNSPRNGSSCCRCKNTKNGYFLCRCLLVKQLCGKWRKTTIAMVVRIFSTFCFEVQIVILELCILFNRSNCWLRVKENRIVSSFLKKAKRFCLISIAIAMAWIRTHPGSIWNIYGKLKRD